MSGIIGASPVDYGLTGVLIAGNAVAKQRETTLTEQTADGLVSDSYSGLGAAALTSLDLNPQVSLENTWAGNISAADGKIQVTQTALTQITSIATSFYSQVQILESDTTGNNGQVGTVASAAREALQQVAALLDSKEGSSYVFAGRDSANPPVPNPDNILNSGFYTQINTAVSQLATNGTAATTASTLATASSNDAGTSPFSAALSQPAAALVTQRTTATVADNRQVPIGLLASANAAVTSTGTSTTGSYMRDLMRALATVGSMTDSQTGQTGFDGLVSDTLTSLDGAITAMSNEAGVLGDTQASMDASVTVITDTATALTSQISNVQNVDLAETASKLSLAQTQLQASYQMIDNSSKMSLVDYI